MQNENINATIQLDKLVMCCQSTVEDNFNDAIKYYPETRCENQFTFGGTVLIRDVDQSKRYKPKMSIRIKPV